MRIGVVTTSYPRAPDDAAGHFVAAHVAWLLERGHEVDVVCAGDAGRTHGAWQRGARVTAVPATAGLFYDGGAPDALERGGGGLAAVRFSARMAATVASRIGRWDMAFAHWLVPSAVSLCMFQHKVTLTQCQAHIPAAHIPARMPTLAVAHSGDVHLLRRLRMTSLCARLLCRADTRVAFVSHALREQFLGDIQSRDLRWWLRQHSLVTPMGIDPARFRALVRSSPSVRGRALRIAFLGRLVPIKGVSVLLEAMRHLHRLWPHPLELTIAGHGPCRAELERQAATLAHATIHFTGELTTGERDRLLGRTDILVLPSLPRPGGRTEGTPVTALEALAAGVPVIASRTGGLAELPDSAVALVPPGDPRALALALHESARRDSLRQRRVQAGLRYVQALDWARVGARLFSACANPGPT